MLRKNGEILETGCSGAVLGNPVTAVVWLANKVAQFGVTLEPGHVILPGSCTRMVPIQAGDTIAPTSIGWARSASRSPPDPMNLLIR
ncbi:MAG: hypothetical protein R2705_05815 [Ilumatobacteraceae bacterium]